MSDKAFDTEKNKEVFAVDCISAKKGRYICHLCYEKGKVVPVFLRKTDGEKAFVSFEVGEHLKGCKFPINQSFKNDYSPDFTRGSLLDRLLKPESNRKVDVQSHSNNRKTELMHSTRPTLKWLYNICIANDNSHEFAEGCTVENSCLKQDTLKYWYNKDKTQYPLLIIGTIKIFNQNNLSLRIAIGNYHIIVSFSEDKNFSKFIVDCKKRNGKTVGTEIYLYGQLTDTEKLQTVTIISNKQIEIVP